MRLKVLSSTRLAGKTNTLASCGIFKRPRIHSLKEQFPLQPQRLSVGVSLLALSLSPFPSSLSPFARSLFASHLKRSSPPGAARKVNCQIPSVIVFGKVCVCVRSVAHTDYLGN